MNIFLNAGHGQNKAGKCAPDKSYYEWQGNRQIVKAMELFLSDLNPIDIIGDSPINIGLRNRVDFVNWFKGYGLYLSVHSNASTRSGWGKARGHTMHYHYSSKNSKLLAQCLNDAFVKRFPNLTDRGIKPANQIVNGKKIRPLFELKNTHMPAVISESCFHDNKDDLKLLTNLITRDQIALANSEGVREYYRLRA